MRIARWSRWIAAAVAGLALSGPVLAGEGRSDPLAQINPEVLFKGLVSEADVALVFAYLREALLAAAHGREAPPPEELNRRAQALGDEFRLRGTLAGVLVLGALEHSAKQIMREHRPEPVLPPSAPGQR